MSLRRAIKHAEPGTGRTRSRLNTVLATLLCIAAWLIGPMAVAQDASRDQMKGLDEQVQEIKSDVLRIAAELDVLEERLLYPSNTHFAVFVDMGDGEEFRLDSVQIQLDGELVAHHIYSFKELEALQKGGVQRIYTGNIPTGNHDLQVSIEGKHGNGEDFSAADSFIVSKHVEPRLVGITLTEPGLGGSGIEFGNW